MPKRTDAVKRIGESSFTAGSPLTYVPHSGIISYSSSYEKHSNLLPFTTNFSLSSTATVMHREPKLVYLAGR